MLKHVYDILKDILKPLGINVTLGSMFILVGVLLLPGIDYGDLNKFASTATPYAISLICVIFGTILLVYRVWALAERARRFDEVKQELEKLKAEGKNSELRIEEIRLQVKRKREDVELRSPHAREHLRLFQDYLSLLRKVRTKAKVEPSDVEAAKKVCETVAYHWDEADRSGIFYEFYNISHQMYPIRMELEDGLERLIGTNANEVTEFCNQLYELIRSLQEKMEIELKAIEGKLFSPDYPSSPDSGQSPH